MREIAAVVAVVLGVVSVWLSAKRIARLRGRTDPAARKERTETWGWLFIILYVPLIFTLPPLVGQEVAVPAAFVSLIAGLVLTAKGGRMK